MTQPIRQRPPRFSRTDAERLIIEEYRAKDYWRFLDLHSAARFAVDALIDRPDVLQELLAQAEGERT
jgi:hypothetical protein